VCPKNHEGRAADDRPLFRRRFRRRHFIVEPSKLWVADIHFPSIFAGFLYFTVLLNARSRPGVRASLGVRHKGMPLPEVRPGVGGDILARHGSEFISFGSGADTRPSVTGAQPEAAALIRSISRMPLGRT
jgi:hypothetical protein